jgi:membrane fusion protein (multidrug efflux system)
MGSGCHDGGSSEARTENGEDDAIAVRVAPVKREPLSSLYSTSATLRAEAAATITARTRGVIRRLLVEEGDRVASGQTVARLEDEEQAIAFERARSNWETKRRELQRAETLHAEDLLAEEAFETTRREAEDARHASELAELALSRTVVRAPFAGTILKRHVDAGATVSDGTPVYDLADLNPLYADVNVPERHVALLSAGQEVRLTADAGAGVFAARIERIAPLVDPATGTVKVTVAVEGGGGLRPGAFVRVDIVTDTHADALVVPRSALVAEGRRWHVYRLGEGQERVEQVEVTLGFEEGDRVEVLPAEGSAEDLAPGARVVVTGASALSDDARVRVVEGDEPGPVRDS